MRRADDPDFRVIKSRVTILDVCARKNVELRGNQHQKTGKCPFPVHTSKDGDTLKVGWSRESKQWVWSCHSSSCVAARGGKKKGGDLIEFVQHLEGLRSLREAGLSVESEVCHSGNPSREIIRYAREIRPDLLVMGAHGHRRVKDLVFGATIDPVRHELNLPILVVRDGA